MSQALLAVAGLQRMPEAVRPSLGGIRLSPELLFVPWMEHAHPDDHKRMPHAAESLKHRDDVVELQNCSDRLSQQLAAVDRVERAHRTRGSRFYAADRDVTEGHPAALEQTSPPFSAWPVDRRARETRPAAPRRGARRRGAGSGRDPSTWTPNARSVRYDEDAARIIIGTHRAAGCPASRQELPLSARGRRRVSAGAPVRATSAHQRCRGRPRRHRRHDPAASGI